MPSRLTCLAILVFWLMSTAWLVRRDLAPHWFADAPPAVVIELADEAVRQPLPVRWQLYRNGVLAAPVKTTIEYRESDDTFSLTSQVGRLELVTNAIPVVAQELRSVHRIDRAGKLLGIESVAKLSVQELEFEVVLAGAVSAGMVKPYCRIETPWGKVLPALDAVPITESGTLNPLHPVNKMSKLRAGQTWRQSVSDPMADALRVSLAAYAKRQHGADLSTFLGKAAPTVLAAEVTGPALLDFHGDQIECWTIEYRGGGYEARTWVRIADGLVLKQEAMAAGETWTLLRD
ncbi:MAG: hypothetical protein K1X57_16545 [Gemmataceae bacterium]|nr:hypothetical protein [Gemmataceae bacterium]